MELIFMKILKTDFKWNGTLEKRSRTDYIILHHRAGNGDVQSIHKEHLKLGYTGIGYNLYIRKDGRIYQGRPLECSGAHTVGYNSKAVGVCFEGNFENETNMQTYQRRSGIEVLKYLKHLYPNAKIIMHRDVNSTACPGKNFPFDNIVKGVSMPFVDIYDIVYCLKSYGIVSDDYGMQKEINNDYNCRLYWLARKVLQTMQNMCYEAKRSVAEYKDINDIAWELGQRGIVSDVDGFMKEVNQKPNGRLYWLARKALTYIRNRD